LLCARRNLLFVAGLGFIRAFFSSSSAAIYHKANDKSAQEREFSQVKFHRVKFVGRPHVIYTKFNSIVCDTNNTPAPLSPFRAAFVLGTRFSNRKSLSTQNEISLLIKHKRSFYTNLSGGKIRKKRIMLWREAELSRNLKEIKSYSLFYDFYWLLQFVIAIEIWFWNWQIWDFVQTVDIGIGKSRLQSWLIGLKSELKLDFWGEK